MVKDNRIEIGRTRRLATDAALFAALATLTACMSVPESRYYTLDMRASDSAAAFQVEAGRFQTTDALSKPEILIQATPTRVEYYAVDRWASDLSEMIREKLQVEFGPVESPAYRVDGEILAFEQVDAGQGADAHAKLRVSVYKAGDRRSADPVLRKTYEQSAPAAGNGPDEIVAALSHTLEVIASQIVQDLSTL